MVTVPGRKLGFPQSMRTTLRYCTKFEQTLASTDSSHFTIRGNSIYDPDYTSTYGDHQPRGSDEFAEIYTDYCVTHCRVVVRAMYAGYNGPANRSTSNVPPVGGMVQLYPLESDYTLTPSPGAVPAVGIILQKSSETAAGTSGTTENLQTRLEYDRSVSTFIVPTQGTKSLRTSMNIAEFFGVKPGDLVGNQEYSGKTGGLGIGSDPANVPYIHCIQGIAFPPALTNPSQVTVVVFAEVEYDVVFTNPKKLTAG